MNNKESSPFTPGSPVPVELFVGRRAQIKELIRYARQSSNGRQEHVFLIGDRGIGKSSLAAFVREYVVTQLDLVGIHVFLGGVTTLEDMVQQIFEQLLKETRGQSWFREIKTFFGDYVKEIGLFGISVSFNPPKSHLSQLVRNFPEALANLLDKIKGEKKGLFIALDDMNGLADKLDFANWYKSFVDFSATRYKEFPVMTMLIGLPEKRDILSKLQPSLMRIFRIVSIDKLSDGEVKHFFVKAFHRAGMEVAPDALQLMVKYSSGLPLLMHEIGDAVFWTDEDGLVDRRDAMRGIFEAAEKVGEKYLDAKVYRAIRSQRYRSILRKLGKLSSKGYFSRKEVEQKLNESERRVFHNFLRRMRELGVLEQDLERGRGVYKFVNEIYPIYIFLESERSKKYR